MRIWSWKWTKLLPLLSWIGVICWIASRPKAYFFPSKVVYGIPRQWLQYPYHVGAFFILAVLFLRCFSSWDERRTDRHAEAVSVLGAMVVSACSELIQFYSPTRTPAVRDLVLDLCGALMALFVMRYLLGQKTAALSSPVRNLSEEMK